MSSPGARHNQIDHEENQEEETNSSNYGEPMGGEQEKPSHSESSPNEESIYTEKTQEDVPSSDKEKDDSSNFRLVTCNTAM